MAGGDGLEAGMKAEIVLAWPPRLDDDNLQLVLEVMITGSEDGVVEASSRLGLELFRA